ncbi:hypothetical protein AAEX63_07115 [Luteococcus sp. H138]|uniref:hypothetical protein n=1 Tax=unclassified Luteococcus TaxID=2639923 RepID=UPI00313CD608
MADNQPRDDHAKQLKQSISKVKQLRGWVSSDPTRTEEFVDALNEATGLRLLSRAWGEAAPEATEAVAAAHKLVASRGPIGPYTPLVDAGRYFTALTHVATLQLGMNLPEPAANTIGAAFGWKDQLTRDGLADELLARTAVWALLATARGALIRGDLAQANAQADATLNRAREANLVADETPVLLDALRNCADARFAVGLTDQSIDLLREAVQLWKGWTAADLAQFPRMAKPHLERLVSPASGLMRDLADRLATAGRVDEALQVRDELATLLHRTAGRRGEPGRVELALARADQVWTLTDAGRASEALRAGEDATQALQALYKSEKPVGAHLPTQLLVAPALARAELAAGRGEQAGRLLDQVFNRMQAHRSITVAPAAKGLALLVRAQVQEAAGDAASAASRAEADQILAELRSGQADQAHHSQADPLTYLHARARGAVLTSQQPTPHWEVPDARATLLPGTARQLAEHQVSDEEAMRRIDEVREQEARERAVAELRESAQRAEREREQAERRAAARAQFERQEAERRAAEEAERAEAERAAAEQAEQERLAGERAERERQDREAAEQAERLRREAQQQESARLERERLVQERAAQELLATEQVEREAAERAEQAERERQEREARERGNARLEAERVAAEQEREQRAAAERAQAERVERERLEREAAEFAAAEQAARQEAERLAREEAERAAAQQAIDPLEGLRDAARDAVASGNKERIIASHEALVAALEPRAHAEPQALGRELVATLQQLSEAQGWWGGRAAGKQAKQLAKQWGL